MTTERRYTMAEGTVVETLDITGAVVDQRTEWDGCPTCGRDIDRLGGNPECVDCAGEPATISAAAIRDRIATVTGLPVHVEQTGGSTATMYVGEYGDLYAWLAIGPGSYNWADPWQSTFYAGDLYVGPDGDDDHGTYVDTIDELADYIQHACPDCGRPDTDHLTRDQWAGDSRDGLGCAYIDGSRQNPPTATADDYLDALGDPRSYE